MASSFSKVNFSIGTLRVGQHGPAQFYTRKPPHTLLMYPAGGLALGGAPCAEAWPLVDGPLNPARGAVPRS
jgi:hypothetical protein